jgi:hypothetical protein
VALTEPLEERVGAERARAYVEAVARRVKPMSVAAEIGHLVLAVSAMAPEVDWKWLRRWQYQYQKRAQSRDKRQKLVHPRRLIDLGLLLMDGAEGLPNYKKAARQFRDGLLIALLAARPLRRRAFSSLCLDRHVHRVGLRFVLAIDADDTKTGQGYDFELPELLAPYFTRYLANYRLRFPQAAAEQALWLSSKGGQLGAQAIYDLVCRRTREAFGFAINPHMFRDIAATAIARDAPEQVAIARDLLTHAKLDTTVRYYTHSQTIEAGRAYGALLDQLGSTCEG